jgi:hypothetical protein
MSFARQKQGRGFMSKSKRRASDDEVCLLITVKRERARRTMGEIVQKLVARPATMPTHPQLLEYLTNMASALELMLKLLSGNWNNHNVGEMHKTVFGACHPDEEFMRQLEWAIKDQKYLLDPSTDPDQPTGRSILHYIPELAALFDRLAHIMCHRYASYSVFRDEMLPMRVATYLRDNVKRFLESEKVVSQGPLRHDDSFIESLHTRREEQVKDAASMIDELINHGGIPLRWFDASSLLGLLMH